MGYRWYQQEAIDATFSYLEEKPDNHPLIVAPTGSGKSHMLAGLCEKIVEKDEKVLVLSHVKEILLQDEEKLSQILPDWLVGLYSAGAGRRERRHVTVAGIQSVYEKAHLFQDVKYVIIDEAHMVPPGKMGRYMKLLLALAENIVVIGLTATPFRLGTGYLCEGEHKLFDEIAYDVDIVRLIKEGYLSPLHTCDANQQLDLTGIRTRGGDFANNDMSEAFDKYETTRSIVDELMTYKDEYKSWLIFAIDIAHCNHIEEELLNRGLACAAVHSKRSNHDNDTNLRKYKEGSLQALVSVAKITTGFDDPKTDLIALIRPTKSPVLHVQMIGRGLRPSPETGKTHCRILDFAGNIARLGPINDVYVKVKGKGGGEAPVKTCPDCKTHVPTSARVCYICGYEFPFKESSDLSAAASTEAAVVDKTVNLNEAVQAWHRVNNVTYHHHKGRNGDSLCIVYCCGLRTFKKWIAVGRAGGAGNHARYFWEKHSRFIKHPDFYVPTNVQEALNRARKGELDVPREIFVTEIGKYPKISSYRYSHS